MQWLYPILSVIIVSAISFIGLWTFAMKTGRVQKIVLYLVSFAAGGLLGDAFLHLLPELVEETGFGLKISLAVLLGIFISFIIEKLIWRHCHNHKCSTSHHSHHHLHTHLKPFAYLNLLGDGIHNFIDGLIIGASYLVSMPVGVSTTLAVILHEIPQEIGDFGVLVHGGFTPVKALFFNFISALLAVLGAVVALLLNTSADVAQYLVPFAAGNFIYIACVDLLPEMHKSVETAQTLKQIMAFALGIGIMLLLLVLLD